MSYTAAQTEPLAQRLVADLPGLNIKVARAWIQAESGGNNNPLGVTSTLGSGLPIGQMISPTRYLVKYATPQAGIDAAAARIKSQNNYAGIRQSLVPGNTVKQQALAIIASPWNAVNSPYYFTQFVKSGVLGSVSAHIIHLANSGDVAGAIKALGGTPGTGGPVKATGSGGAGSPIGSLSNPLSFPVGHALTQADVDAISAALAKNGFTGPYTTFFIGQQWTTGLQASLNAELSGGANTVNVLGIILPVGTKFTQAQADEIMGKVEAIVNGTGSDPVSKALALDTIRKIINGHVGGTIQPNWPDLFASETGLAAFNANPLNTIPALGFFAWFTDPAHLVGLLAVAFGGLIVLFAGYRMASTSGGETSPQAILIPKAG